MAMKIIQRDGMVKMVRTSIIKEHVHTLAFADQAKVNTAIRLASAKEVSKGYSIAAVATHLRAKDRPEDRALLAAAGGSGLTRQHVRNAKTAFKQQFPDHTEMEYPDHTEMEHRDHTEVEHPDQTEMEHPYRTQMEYPDHTEKKYPDHTEMAAPMRRRLKVRLLFLLYNSN